MLGSLGRYLGIWVSRAHPCQPACWIWYCTRPAAWYREYLRLLQSDCLRTTVCTLFACARSVPPHQSRPALGADSQHMAALHKVVIDHSLPPLLNRSIIQINHACIRLEATSLATRAIGIEGVVDGRWAKTVAPHRSNQARWVKSPHTQPLTHSLIHSIHHHSAGHRSLDLSLALARVLLHVSPTTHTHTHTHLGCVSTARCDLGAVLLLPITESPWSTRAPSRPRSSIPHALASVC